MADDKQDTDAAKAYEAASGKLANDTAKSKTMPETAKAEPVKKAEVKKPAAKKAPAKKPAAKKAQAKAPAPAKAAPTPAPQTAPVAKTAEPETEAPAPVAKIEEPVVPAPAPAAKAELESTTAPAAVAKATATKAAVKKAPTKTSKAPLKKAAAKAKPVAKPVMKKPSKAPVAKKPVSKPKDKAPLVAKSAAKPAPKVPAKTIPVPPAKIVNITQEFVKMTDAEMMTKSFQDAMAEMSAKSQDAYKKGSEMFKEAGEFTKGNIEAMVESGKIFASGMQEMSKAAVADGKAEFEALTAEVKEMASVKSPTDFFQLQSAMLRKNFDKAVAMSSKNTEAMLKLANDAAQPLSTRMSLAMEKIKAA